jgi:hypothetical protein
LTANEATAAASAANESTIRSLDRAAEFSKLATAAWLEEAASLKAKNIEIANMLESQRMTTVALLATSDAEKAETNAQNRADASRAAEKASREAQDDSLARAAEFESLAKISAAKAESSRQSSKADLAIKKTEEARATEQERLAGVATAKAASDVVIAGKANV